MSKKQYNAILLKRQPLHF